MNADRYSLTNLRGLITALMMIKEGVCGVDEKVRLAEAVPVIVGGAYGAEGEVVGVTWDEKNHRVVLVTDGGSG